MSDITQLLFDIQRGDHHASRLLLPLVYEELRKLAAAKLALERPGQTLQPTALVHEAYLRLVIGSEDQSWNGRGHFFGAAAEAMRRILVEGARQKMSQKRGGMLQRQEVDFEHLSQSLDNPWTLQVDRALTHLESTDCNIAKLVELRFFAGLTMEEAAAALSISVRTAHRQWTYAQAFLRAFIEDETDAFDES
jgi:RNA polymerase sigma factor (TIGR02999 family)